jgi:hypothetical protein
VAWSFGVGHVPDLLHGIPQGIIEGFADLIVVSNLKAIFFDDYKF